LRCDGGSPCREPPCTAQPPLPERAEADILAALEGYYRPEYLFVLGQLQWEEIRRHLATLDEQIRKLVGDI
jgi:hypothetical protein